MFLKQIGLRSLVIVLSVLLCNLPQYLAAQTAAPAQPSIQATQDEKPQSGDSNAQQQPTTNSQSGPTRYDPAQAPLAPVPSARPAETGTAPPDAPSEVQRSQQAQPTETAPQAKPDRKSVV